MTNALTRAAFRNLNKVVAPAVKAGIANPLPVGVGLVVIETTGRVSGKVRQVPVVGVRFGQQVVVSTVRDTSLWMKNLESDDQAGVWLCGRHRSATATVTRGPLNIVRLDTRPRDAD